MPEQFKFNIGQQVQLSTDTTCTGRITACTKYEHGENQYLVEYSATDGRNGHDWWLESICQEIETAAAAEVATVEEAPLNIEQI